ncbi:hypothetical protein GH865_10065 [Rhodocyclus tenuis]|uniref:hypothetical protein n=1 Tax=Rhodocyclus gracilis TaxID=2929842 RepID=UPI001298E9CF|nr:hypothetical protein [Rhodocyclus gracilis]MRD73593.1 hypothetical protein [Rhodocyclus gracilis]
MRTTPATQELLKLPLDSANQLGMPVSTASSASAISIAALRLPQDFGSAAGVKKVLTTVPFRKPNGQAFFRVHPEWRLSAAILQLKDDGENYIVAPDLFAELAQEVRAKMVYTGVTRDGTIFLWPVNLESEDGRLDSWSQSAHLTCPEIFGPSKT